MSGVFAQITMSLDGFVAGPGDSVTNPLGDGGESLHEWIVATAAWQRRHGGEGGEENEESKLVDKDLGRAGAVIMGRRMFDHGEKPWGPEPPFGMPVFVVTHREREPLVKGKTTFTFVTGGIEPALEAAREAASGREVEIAGGGQVIGQYLAAGLLDDLLVHVAPLFLGGGPRLFDAPGLASVELEPVEVLHAPRASHIRYRRVSAPSP
jgi:dihydrofolate reductase